MSTRSRLVYCIIVLCFTTSECSRILGVFSFPSISHQVVFRPLMDELARRGHEVVVVTTDPAYSNGAGPVNLTEIDIHDVSYKAWHDGFMTHVGKSSPVTLAERGYITMIEMVEVQLKTPQFKKLLEANQTFDLIILEALVPTILGFAHKYNAPVIQMSSFYASTTNYRSMGSPTHTFLYPEYIRPKIRNLTLWEKLETVAIELFFAILVNGQRDIVDRVLKENFGDDTPTLCELEKRIDMLFINTNAIWEDNRPVPSNVVFLGGGLHMKPVKELPQDLKTYLDSSTRGVIYISFGTNIKPSQFSAEKIQILMNVFSRLPYDVLWKWDKDDMPGKPKNIRLFKWVPQNDLLRHPKIKLFITQGGLQSTDEAIAAGVPLIGVPIIFDQFINVEKYILHRIGLKVTIEDLTEENFYDAIVNVIEDESYRNNIVRLRELMCDQSQTPLERAVWWSEYILRHRGAKHLRSPAADASWSEYFELELVGFILISLIILTTVFLSLIYFTLKFVYRKLVRDKKIKNKQN